jgi:hypothetical protein
MKGGKRFFVKQVSVSLVELSVFIIVYLDDTLVYPESVGIIITYFMMVDFNEPIIQILTVKKCLPFGCGLAS